MPTYLFKRLYSVTVTAYLFLIFNLKWITGGGGCVVKYFKSGEMLCVNNKPGGRQIVKTRKCVAVPGLYVLLATLESVGLWNYWHVAEIKRIFMFKDIGVCLTL